MKLETKKIDSESLLLDPRNPRLATCFHEGDGLDASDPVSCQPKIEERFKVPAIRTDDQRETERLLSTDQGSDDNESDDDFFSVKDLVDSIRRIGFVRIQNIIVRPHEESGKYIVLEGNRRVAAIRTVLREHEAAIVGQAAYIDDEVILNSLKTIEVMVFDIQGRGEDVVRDEISKMLGLRHYGSQLNWELLPRAKNIFDEYMRLSDGKEFSYNSSKAGEVAATLAIKRDEVKKLLRGYLCYRQLARDHEVKPHHFSLVLSATEASGLSLTGREYFEIDQNTFELLNDTPEKIDNVCEFSERDTKDYEKIIKDPKQFRKLGQLYKDSFASAEDSIRGMATSYFAEVVNREMSLDDAHTQLLAFKKRQKWVPELRKLVSKQEEDEEAGGELAFNKFIGQGQQLKYFEDLSSIIKRFKVLIGLGQENE
jgi:hypothetical protein